MTDLANQPVRLPGRSQATSAAGPPAERPDGSYVKLTRATTDGRRVVSIMVREDNLAQPGDPRRWRPVEGNSDWFSWLDLHAAGRVEPLYSHAELTAAASAAAARPASASEPVAATHPYHQPPTPDSVNWAIAATEATTRDGHQAHSAEVTPPNAAHRACRPDPQIAPTAHPADRRDYRPRLAAPADHLQPGVRP